MSIFSSPKPAAPPPPPTPVVAPETDDEEARKAKRKKLAQMQAQYGKAGTVLSETKEALGGM